MNTDLEADSSAIFEYSGNLSKQSDLVKYKKAISFFASIFEFCRLSSIIFIKSKIIFFKFSLLSFE